MFRNNRWTCKRDRPLTRSKKTIRGFQVLVSGMLFGKKKGTSENNNKKVINSFPIFENLLLRPVR